MGEELQTATPESWAATTWSKTLDILGNMANNWTKTNTPAPVTPASTTPSWLNAKNVLIAVVGIVALIFVLKKV